MIHLENINKTYHNGAPLHVLKGINLDIERGVVCFYYGELRVPESPLY